MELDERGGSRDEQLALTSIIELSHESSASLMPQTLWHLSETFSISKKIKHYLNKIGPLQVLAHRELRLVRT